MSDSVNGSDELKTIVAENLTRLRGQAGLTQLQLAEMLNYSDKAVSKWERGESIPDLRVLIQLAKIYNITVDDIVTRPHEQQVKPRLNLKKKHTLITLLSVGLVLVVAACVFMTLFYIAPMREYAFLSFVCAPLFCGIVFTVFAALWYGRVTLTVAASTIIWSAVLIIHCFIYCFTRKDGVPTVEVWPFYLAAAFLQALLIGWIVLRKLYKPDKVNK